MKKVSHRMISLNTEKAFATIQYLVILKIPLTRKMILCNKVSLCRNLTVILNIKTKNMSLISNYRRIYFIIAT